MSPATLPRTPWPVLGLALVALVAVAVLVPPFLGQAAGAVAGQEIGPRELLLTVHVTTAGAAILLGTLQLLPRVRRHRAVHRGIGRAFLVLGAVAFPVTGLPLALTVENDVARVGLLVPALLWPVFAVAGVRAIRAGDPTAHRAWMFRLYAVSFFAITARVVVPVLMLLQLPMLGTWYGGDVERMAEASIPVGQWLGWMVDLAIVELVLSRSRRAAVVVDGDRRSGSRGRTGRLG